MTRFTEQRRQHDETQRQVARLQEHQGRLRKADELYEDLLMRDKNNVELCHRLAIVASRQEDWPRAISYFERAIKLAPHDAELRTDLGYALFLSGDLPAAEETLREALAQNARHKRAANNLAIVLGHQERFDEAYEIFRKSVSEAEAHANLAYLYAQCGYGQKAVEHYSRALELDGSLQSAQNGMLQLAQFKQRLDEASGRSAAVAGTGMPRSCGTASCADSAHRGRTRVSQPETLARREISSSSVAPRNVFANSPSDATLARARALFSNRPQNLPSPSIELAAGPLGAGPEAPAPAFEAESLDGGVTQVHFEYAE